MDFLHVSASPEPDESFPESLSIVSDQELERLHLKLCRAVDFEYFIEGISRKVTRQRYRLLNEEWIRRQMSRNRFTANI